MTKQSKVSVIVPIYRGEEKIMESSKYKVSIIIPTYNSEEYLKECLDSAVNQTLKEIEILVVDASSKDNSVKIAEEYIQKDNRVKLIKRPDEYVGISRNAALDIASGEYIMFLDSDDFLEPDACEEACKKITKDNSDFVLFGYYKYGKKHHYWYEDICKKIGDKVVNPEEIAELLGNISAEPWKKIYDRQFLRRNHIYFSKLSFGEDIIFSWKVLLASKRFSVLNKYLYTYRLYDNNVGCSSISDRFMDNFRSYLDMEKVIEKSKKGIYMSSFLNSWICNMFYWMDKVSITMRPAYLVELRKVLNYLNKKYTLESLILPQEYEKVKAFISPSNFSKKKKTIRKVYFLGIRILTVKENNNCLYYCLFGKIKFLKIVKRSESR